MLIWSVEKASFEFTHVTEFNSINKYCTSQPFYQCLGSLLNSSDQCKDHGGICTIFTVESVQLPRCQNEQAHNCSQHVYQELLDGSECRDKELCQMTEYDYTYYNSDMTDEIWPTITWLGFRLLTWSGKWQHRGYQQQHKGGCFAQGRWARVWSFDRWICRCAPQWPMQIAKKGRGEGSSSTTRPGKVQ